MYIDLCSLGQNSFNKSFPTTWTELLQKLIIFSSRNPDTVHQVNRLTKLSEKDWTNEISTEAVENLNIKKYNKPLLIPETEDVKVCIVSIEILASLMIKKTKFLELSLKFLEVGTCQFCI